MVELAVAAGTAEHRHQRSLQLHHLKTKPSDWIYLCEGKLNAVFAYSSHGIFRKEYHGCILRIAKRHFVTATRSLPECSDNFMDTSAALCTDEKDFDSSEYSQVVQDINYTARFVRPTLGEQYVDLPTITCLSAAFVQQLHKITLQQGCIPESRLLKEWTSFIRLVEDPTTSLNTDLKPKNFVATLHRNHTLFDYSYLPRQLRDRTPCSICIEIKPKAGYISRSPLVRGVHRAKFHCHRYGIMQNLMGLGHLVKGWGEVLPTNVSSYSPLDIFSGDYQRTQQAIQELFRNPQNNLRLFYNGALILSNDKSPSDVDIHGIFNIMRDHNKQDEGLDENPLSMPSGAPLREIFIQTISSLISRVFLAEPLLLNLLSLQKDFDLIDADGAVEVYKRLVELCGGSFELAEKLINFYHLDEGFPFAGAHDFFSVTKPACPALDALCSELDVFNNKMKNGPLCMEILDESFTKATEKVRLLSSEGCIWLLQQWLLSLCACDLSLMVCLANFRTVTHESESLHSLTSNLQGFSKAGALVTKSEYMPWTYFSYSLKVADTDPKPAVKLRTRHQKERLFCLSQQLTVDTK